MASAADWLLRMFGALSGQISPGLFEPTSFNMLVNSVQTVAGLLILVGFVLLSSEGVRHDFEVLASRDSLTGALIRRAWNAAAQAEAERGRRHQRALSLIAMDLEHFKQINDAHGHAVGDQVLVNFVAMVGMGVAHLAPSDSGIESLLERADTALFRAKARGRNQVERETTAGDGTPLPPEDPPIKSALRRA